MLHPAALAALERRIALLGERILDTEPIEGADEPLAPVDLGHAGHSAELLGYLCEHDVALADEQVACLFSGRDIDANAAPTHPVHHRQESDFQSISLARAFAIEHRI